jgi:hypothetical protein
MKHHGDGRSVPLGRLKRAEDVGVKEAGEAGGLGKELLGVQLSTLRREALEKCSEEINAVLKKHQCRLVPETVIVGNRVVQRVSLEVVV